MGFSDSPAGSAPPSRRGTLNSTPSYYSTYSSTSSSTAQSSSESTRPSSPDEYAAPKPTILCLHGGGSSGEIFRAQTTRLRYALGQSFEFAFLDAPFAAVPGPGILPFFADCGPYHRWQPAGDEAAQATDLTVDFLRDALDARLAVTGEPYVGVLGFSQGARAAAGLALQQQQGRAPASSMFKFGVFLMATTPPLSSHPTAPDDQTAQLIQLPCVHVVGLTDPWRYSGRRLFAEHFDQSTARLLELKIDHRLPIVHEDTMKIAAEVERLHKETKSW